MREVVIAGTGMTHFGKFVERPLRSLAQEAALAALSDASIEARDVEFIAFGNAMSGLITGQEQIRSEVALSETALGGLPMINIENACGSGSSALHVAWLAIGSGMYDVALVVGAEKLTHPEKSRSLAALSSGLDVERQEELEKSLSQGTSGGAFMMDIYADITKKYMERSGASVEHLADVVVKNRHHASLNPKAQYPSDVSRKDVLDSRIISDPIRLLMCSPIGDGAAALVVCSKDFAKRIGADTVRIRGSALATSVPDGNGETPAQRASKRAYEIAGIEPSDIDVAEMHDASAPAELIHLEELSLCPSGEAPIGLEKGDFSLGGRLPVNPSGGLIGRGHPVGATGCAQIVEITDQLRGRAGPRQIDGARLGIAENQGGYLHPDPAVAVVSIISRD